MIGVASHISAAASGPGARRYRPAMTPAERSHIDNGIWLCASCGVLIDRDEARYTVDALQEVKREHEASTRIGTGQRGGDGDVLAIGREVVAVGSIIRSGADGVQVRMTHFVEGTARSLLQFAEGFERLRPDRRYALLNELGYGGRLCQAPSVERSGSAYEVKFKLQSAARMDATIPTAGLVVTGASFEGSTRMCRTLKVRWVWRGVRGLLT